MKKHGLSVFNFSVCFLALLLSGFAACSSTKPVINDIPVLDYTDEDVVNNEIERINSLLETEPVGALWRSVLLGREDVQKRCIEILEQKIDFSIEEKNYFDAKKYYKSLKTIGWESSKYSDEKIESICSSDIPGLSKVNKKPPKTVSDCMEATVTIWVDRGLKVQNGAGYMDIVIGSGFFIDDRGYIVTNYHVIESMVDPKYEGYSRLYIKLLEDQDTKIPAKVVGYDPLLDLALLKTEIEPKFVLDLGSSSDLHIGDRVSAIGTPIGLEGTLTSGIISSTDRRLLSIGKVFQVDAAVNSGNSGGPLIDEKLKVQAVVFAGMLQYQGLNFAIPVEYLKQELNSLYCNEEVIHPWIAAYGHTKRQGKKKTGLEIQYVLPGGSAAVSGFKCGDVIVEVDGKKVTSLEDFQYLLMAYEYDTLLTCKYIDESATLREKYLYLQVRPKDPNVVAYKTDFLKDAFVPMFGMRLVNSSTMSKNSYTIREVIKGTTADELNFSENDSISVREVKLNKENEYIVAQILAKRRKKGFLDVTLTIATPYDNQYFF